MQEVDLTIGVEKVALVLPPCWWVDDAEDSAADSGFVGFFPLPWVGVSEELSLQRLDF